MQVCIVKTLVIVARRHHRCRSIAESAGQKMAAHISTSIGSACASDSSRHGSHHSSTPSLRHLQTQLYMQTDPSCRQELLEFGGSCGLSALVRVVNTYCWIQRVRTAT